MAYRKGRHHDDHDPAQDQEPEASIADVDQPEQTTTDQPSPISEAPTTPYPSPKYVFRAKSPHAAIEYRGSRFTPTANGIVTPEHVEEFMSMFGAAVVRV